MVFKMAPDGKLAALFSFSDYDEQGGESPDGFSPAQLVNGPDDNFYGTTARNRFGQGAGTIFRITPSGVLTTLAIFDPHADPAWLVQARDGNYYFMTARMGFRLAPLTAIESVRTIGSLNALVQGRTAVFTEQHLGAG